MPKKRVFKVRYDVSLDEETAKWVQLLCAEEAQCFSSFLRKAIRSFVLSEVQRRGWLREREEAAAPQLLTS